MPEDGWDEQGDAATEEATEQKVDKPRMYKVLLHNDNYTTMEFVIYVLMSIFRHSESSATRIMLAVHMQGVGVAGFGLLLDGAGNDIYRGNDECQGVGMVGAGVLRDLGLAQELVHDYCQRVLGNGFEKCREWPYAWAHFAEHPASDAEPACEREG